jgi:hypothetical protein
VKGLLTPLLLLLLSVQARAQSPLRDSVRHELTLVPRSAHDKGAVIGGAMGALALGLFAAMLSQGLCDAADCSGSWREGVGPGVVLGAFGGGLLGTAIGAVARTNEKRALRTRSFRVSVAPGIGIGTNQSEVRTLPGVRTAGSFEGNRLGAAMDAEYYSGSGWHGLGVSVSALIAAESNQWRAHWQAGVGAYSWNNPGHVPLGDPRFPGALVPGRVRDYYLRPVLGFGISVGMGRSWRLLWESRWHHRAAENGQREEDDFVLERSFSSSELGLSRKL